MKNKILLILLFPLFSCSNKEIKTELIEIYQKSAEIQNDTLQIENIEILNTTIVDFDYIQKVKINNLNHKIDLTKIIIESNKENIKLFKKNISRRNKLIKLNPKEKERYLTEIELDQQRLNKAEIDINKNETSIALTHQQIVLMNAELGQKNDTKFDLVEYIFNGKINNKIRVDTMSILKNKESKYVFIKNHKFTKYDGI